MKNLSVHIIALIMPGSNHRSCRGNETLFMIRSSTFISK